MWSAHLAVANGQMIRHVSTGGEYVVRGHSLRVGDLAPLVHYSPLLKGVVVFSRTVEAIQSKFVRMDGEDWDLI